MQLIKLTSGFKDKPKPVYINPKAIAYIEEDFSQNTVFTRICYIAQGWHCVHESIDEVLELIKLF